MSVRRLWLRRVRRLLPGCLLLGAAIALALRLTVRDSIDLVAPLVQGTPPAVLGGAVGVASVLLFRDKRRRLAALTMPMAVALVLWHVAAMRVTTGGHRVPDGAVRVVLWNTRHGKAGFPSIEEELLALDPDVIALIEGGDDSDERRAEWDLAFPDHRAFYAKSGLILLVRGDIKTPRVERIGPVSRAGLAEVLVGAERFRIVFLDVKANPFDSRRPAISALERYVVEWRDQPLVICGDFNTPHDSALFDPWRAELGLRHAFETAGNGDRATWHDWLPLLELDHVWTNERVTVHRCRHLDTVSSDHRLVVFEITTE